jgi:hypothetical protein
MIFAAAAPVAQNRAANNSTSPIYSSGPKFNMIVAKQAVQEYKLKKGRCSLGITYPDWLVVSALGLKGCPLGDRSSVR